MRISDWSSDVCSSDLLRRERVALIDEAAALDAELPLRRALDFWARVDTVDGHAVDRAMDVMALAPLADRKSVVEGKSVSVRVDLGGRRHIKQKKITQPRQIETQR